MARRLIDISVPLQNTVAADPPGLGPNIEYIDHEQSAGEFSPFFPGLKKEDLPDGQGLGGRARPAHHPQRHPYRRALALPSDHERRRARLDDRRSPARLVPPARRETRFPPFPRRLCRDRRRRRGRAARIGHALKPLEIVVVNTSAGAKYGEPDYVASGCGMGAEATLYLLERGVRVDGHRRLELGRALRPHRQALCGDPRRLAHLGGPQGGAPYRLLPYREAAQSRGAPRDGFTVSCFPAKIEGASAGWTRAVAIIDT